MQEIEKENKKYALCLVDVINLGTRTFSYLIPDNLKADIKVGQAVLVPFGYRKQNIVAFVTGFSSYLEEGIKAKEIIKIIDKRSVFSLDYLKLLDWIANYYCCDINTVLQAAVPMKFLKENTGKVQKEKKEKYISFITKENAPIRQIKILEKLENKNDVPLIEFEKEVKTTRATILKLEANGFVKITEKSVYRDPLNVFKNIEKDDFPPLSEEQQIAFDKISEKMDKKQYESILINGILFPSKQKNT